MPILVVNSSTPEHSPNPDQNNCISFEVEKFHKTPLLLYYHLVFQISVAVDCVEGLMVMK